MSRTRVIPALLLKGSGLYKTTKFRNPQYVGDPINAVKIFNDKEVDELCFLDIDATPKNKEPNYKKIEEIASECFMPLSYGGGIINLESADKLFKIGVEKVVIGCSAHRKKSLVKDLSLRFGSQSVVVCIDIKKNFLGKYEVFTKSGKKNEKIDPVEFAHRVEDLGAGELIVNSIDRDGTMSGYDINIMSKISDAVSIPVVGLGGAGNVEHLKQVIEEGEVSAVAAGSMFVFHGKHRAVLISYLDENEIIYLNKN